MTFVKLFGEMWRWPYGVRIIIYAMIARSRKAASGPFDARLRMDLSKNTAKCQ